MLRAHSLRRTHRPAEPLSLGEEGAGDIHDFRKIERPERQIDEMHAQLDNAASARKRGVVEPAFVWPAAVLR